MSYYYGNAPSGEPPPRFYPRIGNQYWAPHAYAVQRPDLEAGYVPTFYPAQGYSTGVAMKSRSSVPWWTTPENYPDRRSYHGGPDWTSNSRFEGSYVSDPQVRGNGRVLRRTWEETAPPDKRYNAEGWYRYKRGQMEIPLEKLKSPDVVDDIEATKKHKDWLWRRVAVQNVNELTPKVLDGGFIQHYGYIK